MAVTKHSASGSFAGYLFQIERLFFWVSQSDVDIVAIETEDDVVAHFNGRRDHEKILEQAKHSISSKIPLSDSSVELWKTLSIWVEREDDLTQVSYSLVTNKVLPSNRLITKIVASKNNKAEFDTAIDMLLEIGKRAKKTTKGFADKVLACPRHKFEAIMKRVELYSPEDKEDPKKIKEFVRSNLGISADLPIDFIYRELLGFVTELIITKWRIGNSFTLERELILSQSNKIIGRHTSKSFVERNAELLPVDREAVEKNRGNTFVDQLTAIGCSELEIIEAIGHYLRSKIEKTRYAVECNVLESKFNEFYKQLEHNWETVFNPKVRVTRGISKKDLGYEIFYETIKYKGTLDGQTPEQLYTYVGAYHHLANVPNIGWHPDWKTIFK